MQLEFYLQPKESGWQNHSKTKNASSTYSSNGKTSNRAQHAARYRKIVPIDDGADRTG
jgi:hypothetical protein